MLCVNDKIYIYDYRNLCWYKWNNVSANNFLEYSKTLYFSDIQGNIYRFMSTSETGSHNDEGNTPINTIWKSKIFDFGADERKKLVESIYYSMNTASRTSVTLSYITENNEKITVGTNVVDLFDYSTVDYSRFTYSATPYPIESRRKIKAKKIVYFQVILENNVNNDSLELLSLDIKYRFMNYVK
jgi:hypothetical protein